MKYESAFFEAAYGTQKQLPPSDLPEIAFSGRSNVGKSSLLNKIFNRKALARVSGTPGKTATVNFFRVGDVRFADLPGYGYARVGEQERRRWADLMEGYFQSGRNIKLVVQLVDMRHKPSQDDFGMLDFLSQTGLNFIIVLTKSDKLNKTEREARLAALNDELKFIGHKVTIIPFSATNGEGTDAIKAEIEKIEL